MALSGVDLLVVLSYLGAIVGMSWAFARRQRSGEEYFLAGRAMSGPVLAASILANQASAVSLVGAPAFVALREGGGLSVAPVRARRSHRDAAAHCAPPSRASQRAWVVHLRLRREALRPLHAAGAGRCVPGITGARARRRPLRLGAGRCRDARLGGGS